MTPTCGHITALAGTTLLAGMAVAAGDDDPAAFLDAHLENGARLFSDVCMASAPDFTAMKTHALEAGFEDLDGRLLFDPGIDVALRGNESACWCRMLMAAPEFPELLVGIVDRLEADYPDAYRDDPTLGGHGYSSIFSREGEDVRLVLNPEKFEGHNVLVGFVVAEGKCPA